MNDICITVPQMTIRKTQTVSRDRLLCAPGSIAGGVPGWELIVNSKESGKETKQRENNPQS